jgi:membrane protein implicated in regulation of membrane protease activity
MAALLWFVLGVVLAVAEAFAGTFVLVMFAAGAFAAAIAAGLGLGPVGQVVVFSAVSALALAVLRPIIRKHALPAVAGDDERIGLAGLEGAPGTVLERVTRDTGLVRVEGELWNARVYDATQVIEPGDRIRVIEVRGTTAMVWRDEFEDPARDEEGTS